MNKPFFITLFLVSLLTIASCGGEYPCNRNFLRFGLIGYTPLESDSIHVRRFIKNSSFATPLDSVILDSVFTIRRSDTFDIAITPHLAFLDGDYDYQVFFPNAGKLIAITEIQEEMLSGQKKFLKEDEPCLNKIISYKRDGLLVTELEGINGTYLPR